jgi:aryl-alcohol dehydrogenase-like predicted oxidoreductase
MIDTMPFGRTGHISTRVLFGAAALGHVTQDKADQAMRDIIHYGINHIDTAADYGASELRIGPWIKEHRDEFFLASKTGERDYQRAKDSIELSLKRLQTDHLDLIQLHAVIEDEELERVLGEDGALKAAQEAKQKGYVRFIGITSHTLHSPAIHMKALAHFNFDSVLLPYNWMLVQNPQYAAEFKALLDECRQRNTAVQLIKTNQHRKWNEDEHFADTWYMPFAVQEAVNKAVWWALGTQPGAFLNSSGDIHILPKFLEAASRFSDARVPSNLEMKHLIEEKQGEPLWP